MRNIEIDKARLFLYNLLSLLFVEEYTKNSVEKIVENLEILSNNAFDEDVSKASKEILEYLKNNGTDKLYVDYQDLFIVPFGEYISLNASWYHEQREGGYMQLKVRDVLAKTKVFFSGCETEALGIGYIEALTQGSNVVMPNAGGGLEIAHELLGKRVFTYRLDMGFKTVYEALDIALKSDDKSEFDTRPFMPKNVAEQYLAVATAIKEG